MFLCLKNFRVKIKLKYTPLIDFDFFKVLKCGFDDSSGNPNCVLYAKLWMLSGVG